MAQRTPLARLDKVNAGHIIFCKDVRLNQKEVIRGKPAKFLAKTTLKKEV